MRLFILLLFSIILLATKCKDDPPVSPVDQLPPITTTGENTFGCLINGEVWLPKGRFPGLPRLTSDWKNGSLIIDANRSTNDHLEAGMRFIMLKLYSSQIYPVQSDSSKAYFYNFYNNCLYDWDSTKTGEVNILHLDTINRIVSGTFWFNVYLYDCDTLEVTDGRFDINY